MIGLSLDLLELEDFGFSFDKVLKDLIAPFEIESPIE
jgi:hypothetical protein